MLFTLYFFLCPEILETGTSSPDWKLSNIRVYTQYKDGFIETENQLYLQIFFDFDENSLPDDPLAFIECSARAIRDMNFIGPEIHCAYYRDAWRSDNEWEYCNPL